jgi:hypothetical protein
MVRCTAVPETRCELIPTSPSWFPVVIRVPTRSPCYSKSGSRVGSKEIDELIGSLHRLSREATVLVKQAQTNGRSRDLAEVDFRNSKHL